MPENLVLFSPNVPFQGLKTKMKPCTLTPGEWSAVAGFRYDDGTLTVRDGISEVTASAVDASPTFLGAAAVTLNNVRYVVAAWVVSGATRIYRLNSGAWTEMTSASGDNSHDQTNRFTSTTARVTFTVVRDSDETQVYNGNVVGNAGARDWLVIQNGVEAPRVWTNINLISPTLVGVPWPHQPITPPQSGSQVNKVKLTWPVYLTCSGATMPTYTASDADVTLASTGTSPNNNIQATFTNATDNGDWVKMDWQTALSAINLSSSKQLIFIYDTTNPLIWQYLKVEISEDDATYTTVYDPTTATYSHQLVEMDDVGKFYAVAFPIDQITSTLRDAVDFIRLTWVGPARVSSDSTITLNIYTIAGSGKAPGSCQHAISYFNSNSRAESVAQIVQTIDAQKLYDIGGRDINDTRIPNSDLLYYTYQVTAMNVSTTDRDAGVDTLKIYRRDPGESQFTQLSTWNEICSWTAAGGWAYTSGSEYSVRSFSDNHTRDQKIITSVKPDALHKVIPVSGAQIGAGGRLFCGNILETASSPQQYGAVWFSKKNYPFRFRAFLNVDDDRVLGANTVLFAGETVKAFAKTPSGLAGGETIWCLTDRSTYVLDGQDSYTLGSPRPMAEYGTPAERSVVSSRGSIWYVDNDKQLRVWVNGSTVTPSRGTIEDKLSASADISTVSGVYAKERYYFSYRPNGGTTNSRICCFNDKLGVFEFDEPLPSPVTAEQIIYFNDSNTMKLYVFATNGKIYYYEDPSATQDLGANISVALSPMEAHDQMWRNFAMYEVGVLADDTSGTLTFTRTAKPDGSTGNGPGVIDMNGSENQVWRQDVIDATTGQRPGADGVAIQLAMTGSLTGATKIYQMNVNVEALEDGFDLDPA